MAVIRTIGRTTENLRSITEKPSPCTVSGHPRFQFLRIHKEEVRDLLDPISVNRSETTNGHNGKVAIPGKPPIQICESSNGVITLAGSTERSVRTLKEMAPIAWSKDLLAGPHAVQT